MSRSGRGVRSGGDTRPSIRQAELVSVTKIFQGVHALEDVSLTFRAGEIVGLLGENGAGKTTLMNVLVGLYRPDQGGIRINGSPVTLRSPRDAFRLGIGMVHQHFMLVESHTVLENLALGHPGAPFLRPAARLGRLLADSGRRYGLPVDGGEVVWQLSAGQQQRVEIARALLRGADLLILDEPTSVLTPQETRTLFDALRRMAAEGHTVVLISHKLDEVLSVCDRVAVLRRGRLVGESSTRDIDARELTRMMVGRDMAFSPAPRTASPGEVVLEVRDVHARGDRGQAALTDVSFEVRRAEILAIAGVSGNGQRELAEAITGLRHVDRGRIRFGGQDITNTHARRAAEAGIGSVPEERMRFGVAPNLLVYENAVLKHHRHRKFTRGHLLDLASIRRHAADIVRAFQVRSPSLGSPIKHLSGGNIQRLILGRELSSRPELLVASHPTYGLDVGATLYLREQLDRRRQEGVAVLLISEDLEEVFALADRIAVLYRGRLAGILDRQVATPESVGRLMTGSGQGEGSP